MDEYDWAGAERELRTAIELNPGDATARQWYSNVLCAQGRHDEAIAQGMRARELDPLSAIVEMNVGRVLYLARRFPSALASLERATALAPRSVQAWDLLSLVAARLGRFDVAAAAVARAHPESGRDSCPTAAAVKALAGDRAGATAMLPRIKSDVRRGAMPSYFLAWPLAAVRDDDGVLDALEASVAHPDTLAPFIGVDPAFDHLRGHPRFQRLLRKINVSAR
jgi:serine/threonine-protein kinase